MATIPTADTLGESDAQPSIQPVTYPRQFGRPNQVGEAISEAAQRVGNAQQQQMDQEDAFGYAQARSDYLVGKVNLETQLTQNPNDWKSAAANYSDGMKKLQADTAATITNPKYQRQFAMEAGSDFAGGLNGIQKWQRGREVDDGRATIDTTTQANLTAAWADPTSAPGIIAAHQTLLDGAVAKGYITDDESVTQQRGFLTKYATGRIASMPDADQVAILGKSLPQRMGGTASSPASPNIKAALLGQESGDNDNAPTSVTGAAGPGQVEPATFAKFGPPGGDIHNPKDNRLASSNYIDHLSALPNVQGDPARIAVGYFSGEGNISAPGSATPYIKDKLSPTGVPGKTKSTSSYVNDVMGRLGPQGAAAGTDAAEQPSSVKTGTAADFLDVPTRVTMLREAQARLRADGAAGAQAYASHARDTISYLQSGGDPSKVTMTPADITANVPKEEGVGLADEFTHALDYNKAVKQIATATPDQVNQILAGHTPQGPTDFRADSATSEGLFKAAQARQTAIYGDRKTAGDPANYAITNMPDVGNAFAAAQKSGKPEDFDAYVKRINGAYDTLGVPPDMRSVLPQEAAKSSVYSIANAAPQDGVARLDALKNASGRWWPAVNRDLVQAGLPAAYQAVGVAAPRDVMVSALQYEATARAQGGKALAEQLKGSVTRDNKPVVETIDKTLAADPGLDSLQRSFGSAGTVGVDFYGGLRDAVRTTAMYLYAKGGGTLSAQDAVAKAAGTITSQFDFVQQPGQTPARLPKGMTSDFQGATQHVLSGLKASDIRATEPDVDETGAPVTLPGPKPFDVTRAEGMRTAGNLDPWNRPALHNPDGSYSTTSSISVGTDAGETLIPTVIDGKRYSNADAIAHFKKTGENFGVFDTPEHADAFATSLHNAQAARYDKRGQPLQDQHQEFATQAARNAYWITVPGDDGAGAVRALYPQSGRPVILSTGKPLDIPFAKMKFYAGQAAHDAAHAAANAPLESQGGRNEGVMAGGG